MENAVCKVATTLSRPLYVKYPRRHIYLPRAIRGMQDLEEALVHILCFLISARYAVSATARLPLDDLCFFIIARVYKTLTCFGSGLLNVSGHSTAL